MLLYVVTAVNIMDLPKCDAVQFGYMYTNIVEKPAALIFRISESRAAGNLQNADARLPDYVASHLGRP
jgi:hypothetical protein